MGKPGITCVERILNFRAFVKIKILFVYAIFSPSTLTPLVIILSQKKPVLLIKTLH